MAPAAREAPPNETWDDGFIAASEGEAKLVALDTTKPDLDEGRWDASTTVGSTPSCGGWDRGPRILVIHHHILAVPGTGRDR
jgi:Icc protein